jgi:hypothetical protein
VSNVPYKTFSIFDLLAQRLKISFATTRFDFRIQNLFLYSITNYLTTRFSLANINPVPMQLCGVSETLNGISNKSTNQRHEDDNHRFSWGISNAWNYQRKNR